MSYQTCASALKTTLLLLSSTFGANDVTEADYRVLDTGGTTLAVLTPGDLVKDETASRTTERQWEVVLDLFMRMLDNGDYKDFATLRDTVIEHLDSYPNLGTAGTYGLLVLSIKSVGKPSDVMDKTGAGPFFITQQFSVIVRERVQRTTGEYA